MKRMYIATALVALCALSSTAFARDKLPQRILAGEVVRCADQARGKWCSPSDNPPPAWDGTPVGGKPVYRAEVPPRPNNPCLALSGNARIACEQANMIAPGLGTILGR